MKSVMKQIIDMNGIDILLSDARFFIGAFCDLSPSSKDIKALRYAMDQGINSIIYNAYIDKNADPSLTRNIAISRLVTEASMSKEKSTQIVDGLFFAIGWDINMQADETTESPTPAAAENGTAQTLIETRKEAEQGDATAQYRLGDYYYYGRGVEKDFVEASRWLRKAAEQGHTESQVLMGACYHYGRGVEENHEAAFYWYRKAAGKGHGIAQYGLATHYFYGWGIEQNYEEAVNWYRKAAEQSLSEAQYILGRCYYYGNGVRKDQKEAVAWYRKAAEQGFPIAQKSLGDCYYSGHGVEKNYIEAVSWYRKAAEKGNADAKKALENIETK